MVIFSELLLLATTLSGDDHMNWTSYDVGKKVDVVKTHFLQVVWTGSELCFFLFAAFTLF